jgi:multiple sugar transport system ATP-binding protein
MAADRKSNLKQVGTPLELYDRPANLFVAKFIGTPPMNVVPVTLTDSGRRLQHEAFAMQLSEAGIARLPGGLKDKLLLGIRPEHIAEAGSKDWPNTTRAQGTVEIVETVGHEVIVHARCGEDMLVAKLGAHRIPRFGEQVELELDNDSIHLFDPESGLSLLKIEEAP